MNPASLAADAAERAVRVAQFWAAVAALLRRWEAWVVLLSAAYLWHHFDAW